MNELVRYHPSGETEGIDPRQVKCWSETKHVKRRLLSIIRDHCADCSGGNSSEARKCTSVSCLLWPYRYGTNPFLDTRQLTEEQRQAAAERFKKAREAKHV